MNETIYVGSVFSKFELESNGFKSSNDYLKQSNVLLHYTIKTTTTKTYLLSNNHHHLNTIGSIFKFQIHNFLKN